MGRKQMNPDIGTMIGDVILLGLLGLYLWWVIVENKRDWFARPQRPTRHISVRLTCIGAIAVVLHVVGFNRLHVDLLWWSMPFLAFVSTFVLGVAKPEADIGTAYRFMTIAGPASILGSPMGFLPLLAGQIGGCLLGFRLGEGLHRVCSGSRDKQLPQRYR